MEKNIFSFTLTFDNKFIIYLTLSLMISLSTSTKLSDAVENNSISADPSNKVSIILQGTYYGGCGFSVMTKKTVVQDIKNYIDLNYKDKNLDIKIAMKNYEPSTYDNYGSSSNNNSTNSDTNTEEKFNIFEFNIFVIKDDKRELVGTSDSSNKVHYFPYLVSVLQGQSEDDFLKLIAEKIVNAAEDKVDS